MWTNAHKASSSRGLSAQICEPLHIAVLRGWLPPLPSLRLPRPSFNGRGGLA